MIISAQRKLEGHISLKGEIGSEMAKVCESMDKIKGKIKANCLTKENPKGTLLSKQEDYLQCLEIRHRDFEQLLTKDELKWAENLETKRQEASLIEEKLKTMLERQKAEIDALLMGSLSMYMPTTPTQVTLKKLPMWGEKVAADAINFEWPSSEMVD